MIWTETANGQAYVGYDEHEIRIDCEDIEWDSGQPVRTRMTYTDLTGSIPTESVLDMALAEVKHEGWEVLAVHTTHHGGSVAIEVGELGPEFSVSAS